MDNVSLSPEEKRCLQMWFRQAIVKVEQEEALKNITKFYAGESKPRETHHVPVGARRTARRGNHTTHKELV